MENIIKEDEKIDISKIQGGRLSKEAREEDREKSEILIEYFLGLVDNKDKSKEKSNRKSMKYSTTITFSNLEIALLEEVLNSHEGSIIKESLSDAGIPNRMRLQESARLREKIETESTKAFYESSERMEKVIAKHRQTTV